MKYQIENSPEGFTCYVFEKKLPLTPKALKKNWEKLNKRETFIKAQLPPYKVEFESELTEGPFYEGELNIHHGPLLSVHGVIGEISESYRDLKYFYGSYFLSFRLVRPTRLEFFKLEDGISLKLHSYVRPWFLPLWKRGNHFFWNFFQLSKP